jgi:hypothetical protein
MVYQKYNKGREQRGTDKKLINSESNDTNSQNSQSWRNNKEPKQEEQEEQEKEEKQEKLEKLEKQEVQEELKITDEKQVLSEISNEVKDNGFHFMMQPSFLHGSFANYDLKVQKLDFEIKAIKHEKDNIELKARYKELEAVCSKLKLENNTVEKSKMNSGFEIQKLYEENTTNTNEINSLKIQLEFKNNKISDLNAKNRSLSDKIVLENVKLVSNHRNIKFYKDKSDSFEAIVGELENKLNELQNEIKEASKVNENQTKLRARQKQYENQVYQLNGNNSKLKSELKSLHKKLEMAGLGEVEESDSKSTDPSIKVRIIF